MLRTAVLVAIGLLVLVFFWRMGREGRRRFAYWRGVYGVWKKNNR